MNPPPKELRIRHLDMHELQRAVAHLTLTDADLAAVIQRHGPPPLWARSPGIETLIRIVLEQQVSLASGRAMYVRLENHLGEVTVTTLLECGAAGLKALGLTRQKAAYCIAVGEQIGSGRSAWNVWKRFRSTTHGRSYSG